MHGNTSKTLSIRITMRIRQWRWNVDSDLTATNKSSPLSHHRVASQASARFMIGRT